MHCRNTFTATAPAEVGAISVTLPVVMVEEVSSSLPKPHSRTNAKTHTTGKYAPSPRQPKLPPLARPLNFLIFGGVIEMAGSIYVRWCAMES
jgi:hypothetical protein